MNLDRGIFFASDNNGCVDLVISASKYVSVENSAMQIGVMKASKINSLHFEKNILNSLNIKQS